VQLRREDSLTGLPYSSHDAMLPEYTSTGMLRGLGVVRVHVGMAAEGVVAMWARGRALGFMAESLTVEFSASERCKAPANRQLSVGRRQFAVYAVGGMMC
jgi:hypothetical protein